LLRLISGQMGFISNGDEKYRFIRTILVSSYLKEFEYLLDKNTTPFNSGCSQPENKKHQATEEFGHLTLCDSVLMKVSPQANSRDYFALVRSNFNVSSSAYPSLERTKVCRERRILLLPESPLLHRKKNCKEEASASRMASHAKQN
jgi:hypothetical protein